MSTIIKNPDVNGVYETKYNSRDFNEPEFVVEVSTSFGVYKVEAYNVGRGFVLENEWCTPTLCKCREDVPNKVEEVISKLENNLDTMI